MLKSQKKLNDSFLTGNEYIFKKYKPIKQIGKGNFGNIYSVINVKNLKDLSVYAMKTEKKNSKHKTLESEAYFLLILQGFGIPKIISYGHTKKYNILIETLLGKSLHSIFIKIRKKCSITDMCLIALQLLDRLEWIHSKNIIYRDVKPENFLIGIDDPNVIYIVDFGLCKKYRSSKTGKHLLPRLTGKFTGTLAYASPNVVKGKESSRRDDLISLGYVSIFLIKRKFPWVTNFRGITQQRFKELIDIKETDGHGELFREIPKELVDYVKYCKNLKFEQDPDYNLLRSLFIKLLSKENLNYKNLSLSWTDNNSNKKLLGLPKNYSARKTNSRYRLLKSIKEERIKRLKSNSANVDNLKKNFSNDLSIVNNNTNLTCETSDKYRNNNDLEKKVKNLKLNGFKKIMSKLENNSFINDNINHIVIKKPNNKSFYKNNIGNNNNIFIPIKPIYTITKNIIKNKKEIPKNHQKFNSYIPFNFYTRGNQNVQSTKNLLFSSKTKKELILSNNIEYKSPIAKINDKIVNKININSYKNILPRKIHLNKGNITQSYKSLNDYNQSRNLYKNNSELNQKTYQNSQNNTKKNLNIIYFKRADNTEKVEDFTKKRIKPLFQVGLGSNQAQDSQMKKAFGKTRLERRKRIDDCHYSFYFISPLNFYNKNILYRNFKNKSINYIK